MTTRIPPTLTHRGDDEETKTRQEPVHVSAAALQIQEGTASEATCGSCGDDASALTQFFARRSPSIFHQRAALSSRVRLHGRALASAGNYRALLASHFLEWSPPSNAQRPQPIKLAPPAPPPARRLPIEIVGDPASDPVAVLRATYARRVEINGGNHAKSRDEIEGDPACDAMLKLAMRVHAARESKRFPGSVRRPVAGLFSSLTEQTK